MTTGTAPALNEPAWLAIARKHASDNGLDKLADERIPPPGDGAEFVGSCLQAVGFRSAPESASELSMWGDQIDPAKRVPPVGSIVVISSPNAWRAGSPAAQKPATATSHVGFLVRSTATTVYVLGEGVVRAFPRTAVSTYRWPS